MERKYIDVFSQFKEVGGFFSTKYGASEGYPYNRRDIFKEAGAGDAVPVWPRQVHGNRIAVVSRPPEEPLSIEDTDGVITNQENVLLTTVHADCLPVYFFDRKRKVIGLVHAGWRGTVASIAVRAVCEMERVFGSGREDINVYIGPGISRCCFETGREVYNEFAGKWSFMPELTHVKINEAGEEKYYIDLKGVNLRLLEAAGIAPENIEVSPHCTCCEPELFCSYRREGGTYKRMGAGLWLNYQPEGSQTAEKEEK